jgi:Peptidase family M23
MIKLLFIVLPIITFAQQKNEIRKLQKGLIKEDSSFVYWLPYKENTKQLMVQGYLTKHSHKTLIANDFKMKMETIICAARSGIVINVMEESNIGGLKDKENHWNYIVILHNDSSEALYGHLQYQGAIVKIGDTVLQGQQIGLSGNTGYSAFPHLHFQVFNKEGQQIPVRFFTKKGNIYLKQMRLYKSIH